MSAAFLHLGHEYVEESDSMKGRGNIESSGAEWREVKRLPGTWDVRLSEHYGGQMNCTCSVMLTRTLNWRKQGKRRPFYPCFGDIC